MALFLNSFFIICKHNLKTNLPRTVSETASYLWICVSYENKDFEKIEAVLNKEISLINYGFIENKFAICKLLFSLNKIYSFFLGKSFNRA